MGFVFMAAGKNNFVVTDRKRIYLHETFVDLRTEDLPELKTYVPKKQNT